jgi:antitoxin HicB
MSAHFDARRLTPMPSAQRLDERLIDLPLSIAAKVLLVNTMLGQKVAPADLARRMGATRQEVHRLTDLTHNTKTELKTRCLR